MPKKADKRKKKKPAIKQKQKQVQIVNVYYDRGKRRVAYKRRSPPPPPPPPPPPRPPLVIPEVRYIANYGSANARERENDLIKLLALSSNQMEPTALSNQDIYDRLQNQGFLDLLQKKTIANLKKEQGEGEQGEREQGRGDQGGAAEDKETDDDRPQDDDELPTENYINRTNADELLAIAAKYNIENSYERNSREYGLKYLRALIIQQLL